MDTNKILYADFLDILFDNRNKLYGAYELRRTYSRRITKSLIFTGIFVTLVFAGVVMGSKHKANKPAPFEIRQIVELDNIKFIEPKPEQLPDPPPRQQPPKVKTEVLTNIVITKDDDVTEALSTQENLKTAAIGADRNDGIAYDNTLSATVQNETVKIIEQQREIENPGPLTTVQIEAKFDGDWRRFLEKNLNPQVALDHSAPPGLYTVMMQFVVDTDGSISDIRVLSDPGFGLAQEAIRVIKKSKRWEAAIQNGKPVKAYRKQPITFQITGDY